MKIGKKFTIIICTYNSENRIGSVLDSIINQHNIELLVDKILIVDNNSIDNTKNIVNTYQRKYKNIQYVFEEKQGLSNARLAGVLNTYSEWIIFIDDDNILKENWIDNALKYLNENNNVGAFNGAVVPKFDFKLTSKEKDVLNAIYSGLACTHIDETQIDLNNKEHPNVVPFGAGLVIRTDCLKKLAKEGWLQSKGRTGNKIVSGEDSEMCFFIRAQGYKWGYNPEMLIYHMIGKNRLTEEYAINLFKSFSEYNYNRISNENLYILRRIKSLLKCIISITNNTLRLKKRQSNSEKLKCIIKIKTSQLTIKNIIKDKLILKSK